MGIEPFHNLGRRDFIKYSLLAAGALYLPSSSRLRDTQKKCACLGL